MDQSLEPGTIVSPEPRIETLMKVKFDATGAYFQSEPNERPSVGRKLLTAFTVFVVLAFGILFAVSLVSNWSQWLGALGLGLTFLPLFLILMWAQGAFVWPRTKPVPGASFQILPQAVRFLPERIDVPFANITEIRVSSKSGSKGNLLIPFRLQIIDFVFTNGSANSFMWLNPRRGSTENQLYMELNLVKLLTCLGFSRTRKGMRQSYMAYPTR